MRLWSFHPGYLDNVGLSRCINEGKAGFKALRKIGAGYPLAWEKHTQLKRFREQVIDEELLFQEYMRAHVEEQYKRNCHDFDLSPFSNKWGARMGEFANHSRFMTVTKGQLDYEWKHYLKKLKLRNPALYEGHMTRIEIHPHPIFRVIPGEIENWEKVKA